jgi:hypothetical protein
MGLLKIVFNHVKPSTQNGSKHSNGQVLPWMVSQVEDQNAYSERLNLEVNTTFCRRKVSNLLHLFE